MSGRSEKGLIKAIIAILGLIIFCAVGLVLYNSCSIKFENNSYSISESFYNIQIDTDTADIIFTRSDDGISKVECYENELIKHSVEEREGTLYIKVSDTREWYERVDIITKTQKITIHLSEEEYGLLHIEEDTGDITIPADFKFENAFIKVDTGTVSFSASSKSRVSIETSTGDINAEDITAESVSLKASTGKITISNVKCVGDFYIDVDMGDVNVLSAECGSFASSGDTGRINLSGVVAKEKLYIERSTGDVTLDGCDAMELKIETDTGDISGTLLSDKIFMAETDTGKVDVPQTTLGGSAKLKLKPVTLRLVLSDNARYN